MRSPFFLRNTSNARHVGSTRLYQLPTSMKLPSPGFCRSASVYTPRGRPAPRPLRIGERPKTSLVGETLSSSRWWLRTCGGPQCGPHAMVRLRALTRRAPATAPGAGRNSAGPAVPAYDSRMTSMPTRSFTDVALSCAACGDDFVFTACERELQALRGLAQLRPDHCSRCRRNRSSSAARPQTVHAPTGAPHPPDSRGAGSRG